MKQNYRAQFLSVLLVVVLVLFALPLGACSKSKEDFSDTYNAETDFDYSTFSASLGGGGKAAKTKDGCYFIEGDFLYFLPNNSDKPVVSCGKPNCLHVGETSETQVWKCDGYYNNLTSIFAGKDYLFITCRDITDTKKIALWQVSFDGSQRKKLFDFGNEQVNASAVHRNFYYCASTVFDESGEMHARLTRRNLSNLSAESETLWESDGTCYVRGISMYGKHLYFSTFLNSYDTTYHYDLETKECTKFLTEDNTVQVSFPLFLNQRAYSTVIDMDAVTGKLHSSVTYVSNLDGSDAKTADFIPSCQYLGVSDGKYQYHWQIPSMFDGEYIDDKYPITSVYDSDGNEVAHSNFDFYFGPTLFTDQRIFFSSANGHIAYFDRTAMEKGNWDQKIILDIGVEALTPKIFVPTGETK